MSPGSPATTYSAMASARSSSRASSSSESSLAPSSASPAAVRIRPTLCKEDDEGGSPQQFGNDVEEEAEVPCADMAATQAFGNDDDSGSEPAEPARLVRLDDGGAESMAAELPDGIVSDVLCLGRERQPAERDGLRVVSVVVSDPLVSRLHAELCVEGGPVARREAAMRDSRPGAPRR